jgi:Spy/CpxP family protein refolding chaperone
MKKIILLLTVLVCNFVVNAQQGSGAKLGKRHGRMGQMKEKIELYKIQFFTEKLSLTTNEAEQFWPIYEAHKKAMKEIMQTKSNDEIGLQEATLNARKKYKNDLKSVFKNEDRINEALKLDREFMKKVQAEMLKRRAA